MRPALGNSLKDAIKYFTWLLALWGFEYWLVYSVPPQILTRYPALKSLVDAISTVAPVVHNFDRISPNAEFISFFFAVTTLLMILKCAIFFRWLNFDRVGMYRHFVISPLTATSPKHGTEFVTDALEDGLPREEKSRSLTSRVGWSLLVVLIGSALILTVLISGWEIPKPPANGAPEGLADVAKGGLSLWLYWSVKRTTFAALLLAILASIVRDYVVFLRGRVSGTRKTQRGVDI
jgi:hypothetical protein